MSLAHVLPSYWLVQAGHVGLGGDGVERRGWMVIAIWSVAMAFAAAWAYRRDTQRV